MIRTGSELQVGDTIKVWWAPNRDTILSLEPYHGPLRHLFPKGAQIASFAIGPGMTIDNGDHYELIASQKGPRSMTTHKRNGYTIHTECVYPPIPVRNYDWQAHLDDYDGAPDAGPQYEGTGRTEEDAIKDLLDQLEEADQERAEYETRERDPDDARDELIERRWMDNH